MLEPAERRREALEVACVLDQVLKLEQRPHELECSIDAQQLRRVRALVLASGAASQVRLYVHDPSLAAELRAAGGVSLWKALFDRGAPIVDGRPIANVSARDAVLYDGFAPSYKLLGDEAMIERSSASGVPLHVWVVDDDNAMAAALAVPQVASVISNRPLWMQTRVTKAWQAAPRAATWPRRKRCDTRPGRPR